MNDRQSVLCSLESTEALSRRVLLRWCAAAGALVVGTVAAPDARAATATPTARAGETTEIGLVGQGETSFEVVAKIDQKGVAFTFYGYLTRIAGLDDALLFAKDVPLGRTETAARFTVVGTSTVADRSVLDTLFVLDADGAFDIHFNEVGGAKFDSPAGFSKGTKIATMTSRAQDVINLQSPNKGIATGVADLAQTKSL
jgi:hypothetical protein